MKKLLISLSFLGTGTIVGAATLPAIVSCVPITHGQMLEKQIEKDYVAIFSDIEKKYNNMSNDKVKENFIDFVFPKNKKMNMTHGYDVMQWNTIVTYTYDESKEGFDRGLIPMTDLKVKLSKIEENQKAEDDKINLMRDFMKYDEILRIMANDFNRYKNIFRSFSETRLVNASTGKNTEWSNSSSTTMDIQNYYYEFKSKLPNSALISDKQTLTFSRSLPLNPDFEKALALVISFKNASLSIDKNNTSTAPIGYRSDGMMIWLNEYWRVSCELGFLPSSYNSVSGTFKDEIVRTSQMDSFRTELFNQSVSPVKSKYYYIGHDIDIDNYLDDELNIENHPPRWMNPKDLIDYFSSIINPIAIFGITNSLLQMVKVKKEIIDEPGISMNLKFSNYLIENIHQDHLNLVLNNNDINRRSQLGGPTMYLNINNKDGGVEDNRFLNSNQVDLSVDYKNVKKV